MRFLLIGNPPLAPAVAEAVTRHGHQPATPESINLTHASPKEDILKAAERAQLDILTADPDLAEAPYALDYYFPRAIVWLQLTGGDVEQDDAIDRLFERYKAPKSKRLYTVTENRVKIRQLPGAV
jgi:predicted nuclease of predicted toxin-antitoxin system